MMMIVMHDYGFNSEAMVMMTTTLKGLQHYSKIMITLRTSAISHHSLIMMITIMIDDDSADDDDTDDGDDDDDSDA